MANRAGEMCMVCGGGWYVGLYGWGDGGWSELLMLPPRRQRLMIGAAIVVGIVCLLLVRPVVASPDASSGIALVSSQGGLVLSTLAIGAAIVPAGAMGVFASAVGSRLAGMFVISVALSVLAGLGGPIDGFLRRVALPGGYVELIGEMLLWTIGWLAVMMIIGKWRDPTRTRLAALSFQDHLGIDANDDVHGIANHVGLPPLRSLAAGAVCTVVGGALAWFLMRDTSTGQVFWSLIVAFTLGGLAGRLFFPHDHVGAIVISPCVVAVIGYAIVAMQFSDGESVFRAWHNMDLSQVGNKRLPGLALALPIHYASAGVLGTILGIGWANGLEMAKRAEADAAIDANTDGDSDRDD